MLYSYSVVIITICFLLLSCHHVTCCNNQCYEPEGTETRTSGDQNEADVITNGICYSSCTLNVQTYQIENFNVVNTSSLNCFQQRQLNGCITGCNTTEKISSSCQELCSVCQISGSDCNNCDHDACMIGCNTTTDINKTGINLDKINVTLIPVPGELYVYKASIESIDADNMSVSTVTSGISSFIIRVSTKENNLTTYSMLYDPAAEFVDLSHYAHHCKLANVSVAVVNSNGVSEYSSPTEMCISAIYPKAPTGLQTCFGEKLVYNLPEQWIIKLKWNLPEDRTYLQGFELKVISTTDKSRCKEMRFDNVLLEKNQTSYTLSVQEDRCDYQITLTSLPKNNGNNSVVTNQNGGIPDGICPVIRPVYNVTLIQQYNNDGTSKYNISLMLESDPAALQGLSHIEVAVEFYEPRFPDTPANSFPQILLPLPNTTAMDDYGSECFSEKNRRYTCSGNCNSLQYRGSKLDHCIEECERTRRYTIQMNAYPTNETLIFHVSLNVCIV